MSTAVRTSTSSNEKALARAIACARVGADNNAKDILVLDMRGITPLYDYCVLMTGTSRRQAHAVAEQVDDVMTEEGEVRRSISGYRASRWIAQDYGDVIIHIFDPDTRSYYALEELWTDAPRVDWSR